MAAWLVSCTSRRMARQCAPAPPASAARAASVRPRGRPSAARPRWSRAAPRRERGRNSTIAVPANWPPSVSATIDRRGRRAEKMPQTSPRQAVGREHAMLELHERVDVAALGLANAELRLGLAGRIGCHRHQRGRRDYQLGDQPAPCCSRSPAGADEKTVVHQRDRTFEPDRRLARPTGARPQRADGKREQQQVPLRDAPRNKNHKGCDRRVRPHPPPRRSRRPARIGHYPGGPALLAVTTHPWSAQPHWPPSANANRTAANPRSVGLAAPPCSA